MRNATAAADSNEIPGLIPIGSKIKMPRRSQRTGHSNETRYKFDESKSEDEQTTGIKSHKAGYNRIQDIGHNEEICGSNAGRWKESSNYTTQTKMAALSSPKKLLRRGNLPETE